MAPTPIVPTTGPDALITLWEENIDDLARRRDLAALQRERDQHALSCVSSLNNGSVKAAGIFARVSAHAETAAAALRAEIIATELTPQPPLALVEAATA